MKAPGFMAITAGEVIHIIKCIPVEVKIRHTDECYVELPAYHGNISVFVSPKSEIITRQGTQQDCNNLLPVMHQIDDIWYKFVPKPVESLAPQVLQPSTKPTWKYLNPGSLASSGIYSDNDLSKLRDHIMFPVERPALMNTIVRGATGHHIPADSISMYNFLDEKTLSKIASSTSEKIWGGFITFGSASVGILGIWIVIRLIKMIIDILLHGYAIYTVFGWSFRLLASFWSSSTNLILHLGASKQKTSDEPLQVVTVSTPEEAENQLPSQTIPNSQEIELNAQKQGTSSFSQKHIAGQYFFNTPTNPHFYPNINEEIKQAPKNPFPYNC